MFDVASVGSLTQASSARAAAGEKRAQAAPAPGSGLDEAPQLAASAANAESGGGATAKAVKAARQQAQAGPETRLSILFDDSSRLFVTRSVSRESGEVVNQFPPKEVVRRVAAFVDKLHDENRPKLSISA